MFPNDVLPVMSCVFQFSSKPSHIATHRLNLILLPASQINGRNVDNKTVDEAIQIIGLSKDKLTMLVKSESGGTVSIPASHFAQPSPSKSKHGDREKVKHAGTVTDPLDFCV